MAVEILVESSLTPRSTLGPYRKADYMELPDEPRCELIYGRFYVTPSPTSVHQLISFRLARLLDDIADQSGGAVYVAPLDVVLADHSVVQPDILYVSAARRAILQERIEGAPDLLIEVLSPSTTRQDRGDKLKLYAEFGVAEYWLVDPMARQIEFLMNRDGHFEVVLPADGMYRSPALPEIGLDLVAFWQDIDRRNRSEPATARPL